MREFDSTSEAYDSCQCDDSIKNGDLLVVRSEKVIGLAWAWPVAITRNAGCFHRVKGPLSTVMSYKDERVFSDDQIKAAEKLRDLLRW